jgi:hypothetical protein
VNGSATIDPSTMKAFPQCDGAIQPERMCGWVSFDPTNGGKIWCPAEVSSCCPPDGGSCVPKMTNQ